jgi:hypothetical protein
MIKSALIKDYLKKERGYKFVSVKEIDVSPSLMGIRVLFQKSESETELEFIYMFDLIDFTYSKIKENDRKGSI